MAASWLLALVSILFNLNLFIVVMDAVQVNQDVLLFGLPGYAVGVIFFLWLSAAVLIATSAMLLLRWRAERRLLPVYVVFTGVSGVFAFLLASWGMFS